MQSITEKRKKPHEDNDDQKKKKKSNVSDWCTKKKKIEEEEKEIKKGATYVFWSLAERMPKYGKYKEEEKKRWMLISHEIWLIKPIF